FAYDVPTQLLKPWPVTCAVDMYYMETLFPTLLSQSPFASTKANAPNASWYLIPQYSTCYYHHCVFNEKREPEECKIHVGKYVDTIVDHIALRYPFWNKTQGSDHVLVFPWDQASEVLGWGSPYQKRISPCVHLSTLGTAHRYENHDPHKDIVIPPYANFTKAMQLYPDEEAMNLFATAVGLLSKPILLFKSYLSTYLNLDLSWIESYLNQLAGSSTQSNWLTKQRSTFGYFRGTIIEDTRYSFGVRQYLRELGRVLPAKYHIHELHSKTYWEELGDSVFSFCPSGWSPWSPRLFDSIMAGAIPVIYADNTRLPFEHVVDYKKVAVKLANEDVHRTDAVLS
ncbi:hypothetical protein HDV05_002476, partial [Chytridiales sp. JEL 0842]